MIYKIFMYFLQLVYQ